MLRTTLMIVVEGQSENAFLEILLAPHLANIGIDCHFPIIRRGRNLGGVLRLKLQEFCDQVRRHLLDGRRPVVSMFFDYYGFPTSEKDGWNFLQLVKDPSTGQSANVRLKIIETELHTAVCSATNIADTSARFIPYIQLHELEALFFSDPAAMADTFGDERLTNDFLRMRTECGGCEAINDSVETARSKRIQSLIREHSATRKPLNLPSIQYIKGRNSIAHAPRIAAKLALENVREKCPRFSNWVTQLEQLAPHTLNP